MAHGLSRQLLDSHIHLWDLVATPQDWIEPDWVINRDFDGRDLSAALSSVGITSAIAVQADHSLAETRMLLSQCDVAPELVGVVGWVDVTAPVAEQVAELRAEPNGSHLVGIRHLAHVASPDGWLRRDDVGTGIRELGELGLSFDLVVRSWQLQDAAALADRAPDTTFVLDHLGGPDLASGDFADWLVDLGALAARPNVVAKLSGLTSAAGFADWTPGKLAPAIDHALETFGPSRLMFGSDWPLVLLSAGGYEGWLAAYLAATAALSPDEQAAIDNGTARAAYRL